MLLPYIIKMKLISFNKKPYFGNPIFFPDCIPFINNLYAIFIGSSPHATRNLLEDHSLVLAQRFLGHGDSRPFHMSAWFLMDREANNAPTEGLSLKASRLDECPNIFQQ